MKRPRLRLPLLWTLFVFTSLLAASIQATEDVALHEKGRCSMRGQCGAENIFGKNLPCPDNGPAETPTDATRDKLVEVCGDSWSTGDVCCTEAQIDALRSNLKQADTFIFSCPACRANFYNLFCTFTCSPDQSTFVNVTDTGKSMEKKDVVTELDNFWTEEYGNAFYDSCKDIKFAATGGKAMDWIGGGAKTSSEFLSFLGKKSLLGSPFQINFPPVPEKSGGIEAANPTSRACNDPDPNYRCACVDCPSVCPELPAVTEEEECFVGALPCLSFASVLVYSILVGLTVTAIVGHIAYRRHTRYENERLRLLQDAAPSDDEDEGDMVLNAGIVDQPQRDYRINAYCDAAFARLGGMCARYPLITIISSILAVLLLSLGWLRFEVETDPVRLWVSPTSAVVQEKQFFDDNFGPFFRIEQTFLVNETGPVLSYDTLSWWFDVEAQISRLKSLDGEVTLDDVCSNPTGDGCVVESITGYFQGDVKKLKPSNWREHVAKCAESPGEILCLPTFKLPLPKKLVLGGADKSGDPLTSSAIVTTWVVSNDDPGSEQEKRAKKWEASLRDLLKSVQKSAEERGLRLSFSTEISLKEELNKSSNTDVKIVVISYVIMFIYASLALGSSNLPLKSLIDDPAAAMVQSKFTLGIVGIIIVLMSVSASVGLFSAAGVKVTLIIAEVIPFLVLAIGVDNIFLIVHEFERVNRTHPDEEIDVRVAKALGRMGPSILFSATTETVAFVLGVAVGMPAVKNFAAYAAGAVVINALLQVTLFVAILALNQRRVETNRLDCFPFLQRSRVSSHSRAGSMHGMEEQESLLQRFVRKHYAPFLLNRQVKVFILVLFAGIFAAGLALIPAIPLGLDQRVAIPDDSYLISYFDDMYDYFETGPPVYFVTRDVNATARPRQRELCGRFSTCSNFSVPIVLEQEAKRPEVSYVDGVSANWLDDFFFWLNPLNEGCCKDEMGKVCFADRKPAWNITLSGMPQGPEFLFYADKWLSSTPDANCPLAGKAAYGNAVVLDKNRTTVPASNFRTSHTPLHSQEDFISAYAAARRIADEMKTALDIDVFPYSSFYIFFDQYASIRQLTAALLGGGLGLILLISSVFLGSVLTGAAVTMTVGMVVVDVLGSMAVSGVSLNAVSLVNLVICLGLGVEFCAHVARAFAFPGKGVLDRARLKFRGRDARAWASLVDVGASVFSGITLTKLLGVAVLAFTRSKIFEVYYFRVWLALVIWAATHALIFLPVLLSLVGGDGYMDPDGDGGLEEDLVTRRYRALIPEEDYDSDDY